MMPSQKAYFLNKAMLVNIPTSETKTRGTFFCPHTLQPFEDCMIWRDTVILDFFFLQAIIVHIILMYKYYCWKRKFPAKMPTKPCRSAACEDGVLEDPGPLSHRRTGRTPLVPSS
ncbi:hypothetical protein T10_2167 [Trichinella papuae]|uniref:Uncharacterized protein n=1 Tax=Trichinella papuae TaxID=268474 RepID=A0A0V1N740_9BILA|nr:hypothetical protein T10_2167 [Trichinella papuae]